MVGGILVAVAVDIQEVVAAGIQEAEDIVAVDTVAVDIELEERHRQRSL